MVVVVAEARVVVVVVVEVCRSSCSRNGHSGSN